MPAPVSSRTPSIVVIDYNGGNLASAARALARAAQDSGLDAEVTITADPQAVRRADRIVLPGQGAFADCASGLAAQPGLRDAIVEATDNGVPFLGICVGMQLMAERGREHGVTPGFGWIAGEIRLMDVPDLRLPQMGWNQLEFTPGAHPLTEGLAADAHGYFVHSFALADYDPTDMVATTDYGGTVPAIVARGNRAGTQFHVEKSQGVGLRILSNFLRWIPTPDGTP
ncbi:MAG: imidazole glycerol phosphate synthase subunit HisH [Komagataeibacter saccharivorans]|uniref:imidazole glycerol phosphate synthase subunit HisH n=1 Tax=Komagataeibacter saccharivorans TaxID=265959 RepID=UPI0039EA6DA9